MSEAIQNAEMTKIANEVLDLTEDREMPRALVALKLEAIAQRAGDVQVSKDDEEGKREFVLSIRAIVDDIRKGVCSKVWA